MICCGPGVSDGGFPAIVNAADLDTPDGVPLVCLLRRNLFALKEGVCRPTLMRWVLAEAAKRGIPDGAPLAGTPEVLAALVRNLRPNFVELRRSARCARSRVVRCCWR